MARNYETLVARDLVGFGVLGLVSCVAGVVVSVAMRPAVDVSAPTVLEAPIVEDVAMRTGAPTRDHDSSVPSDDIFLVFWAGTDAYVALADLDDESAVRHGKGHLSGGQDLTVLAPIARADLPHELRGWIGRSMNVEGGCRAKLTSFVVAARVGDGYESEGAVLAGNNLSELVWNRGSKIVAAKLDGCDPGSTTVVSRFARAASAPVVTELAPISDERHAAEARERLLHSSAFTPIAEIERDLDARFGPNHAKVSLRSDVWRHPTTGVTWIAVYGGEDENCGRPSTGLWGLFRVDSDGSLTTVQLRRSKVALDFASLIDVDGDGDPELVGRARDWSLVYGDVAGDVRARLSESSLAYECGC